MLVIVVARSSWGIKSFGEVGSTGGLIGAGGVTGVSGGGVSLNKMLQVSTARLPNHAENIKSVQERALHVYLTMQKTSRACKSVHCTFT